MTSVTWRHLSGDTQSFAVEFALCRDEETPFDEDLGASWGMFSVWVEGVNLCSHEEAGERVEAVHWYLLPLLEWLAAAWDPLVHEERLPDRGVDAPAAAAQAGVSLRSSAPDWSRAERLYAWRNRHSWRVAADGGIFPDIWMRRRGDRLELAVGAEMEPGQPEHFRFRGPEVYLVDAVQAAEALHQGIQQVAAELQRRHPGSERLRQLDDAVGALADGLRHHENRLAWLSGAQGSTEGFSALVRQVEAVFESEGDSGLLESAVGRPQSGQVVLVGARVALLFGSSSPTIDDADVDKLSRAVLAGLKRGGTFEPPEISWMGVQGSPGQQGSILGEDAYSTLAEGRSDSEGWVDLAPILRELGVGESSITLSDPEVRGVSILIGGQGASIWVNENYKYGQRDTVVRFTLAHELAHLLLDRERGVDLAIVSGDWAPLAVEQRANAFAASLLMPRKLVLAALQRVSGIASDLDTVRRIARDLRVSVAALADRMYNLDLLNRDERDIVRGKGLALLTSSGPEE